ncbi:LamG domain-containing protein [Christiangramia marina]|uniref:LamG domain-containing protein n=1 Tax=Christiangramia marina TaxID=409436 RepID=UPI003AA7F779
MGINHKYFEKIGTSLVLSLLGFLTNSFAQCPTVLHPEQIIYREIQGNQAQVKELDALDQGGGVAWYLSDSSTEALSETDILSNNTTYYVGSFDGSCNGNRSSVTVQLIDAPEIPITSGLLAYFPLDGNGDDISGNNYQGKMNDVVLVADRYGNMGKALRFSTNQSYIRYGDILDMGDGDFTINSWINHNNPSGIYAPSAKSYAGNGIFRYGYGIENSRVRGFINWGGSYEVDFTGDRILEVSTWHMITITYDRDGMASLYIDGELEKAVDMSDSDGVHMNSKYEFRIGEYDYNVFNFVGTIDDVSIYNKALAPTEINQLFLEPVSSLTFQKITGTGKYTVNRLNLYGGLSIYNDNLYVEGNSLGKSYPISVAATQNITAISILNGGIAQGETKNNFEGNYRYYNDGVLQYYNKDQNSNLSILSLNNTGRSLLSLQLNNVELNLGHRTAKNSYSLRDTPGIEKKDIDFLFKDNDFIPITFNSDTTTIFKGQLQLGDLKASSYDLVVGGAMISESMVMEVEANWPDYVFSDEYILASLNDLNEYIFEHGHLPGLPTAEKVAKRGIDIAETERIILEKIEELTLHLIKINNQIERIKLD